MIKKYFFLYFGIVFFSACTAEESKEQNESSVKLDTLITLDTSANNNVKETDPTFENFLFEDYGKLENRSNLIKYFSEENLENGTSFYAEGTMKYAHTIVKNPANKHVVKVVWSLDDTNKISFVEASHAIYDEDYEVIGHQDIQSEEGLQLGMSIQELVEWNENQPIEFAGFAWDFHGGVFPKEGSKIAKSQLYLTLDYIGEDGIPADFLGDVTLTTTEKSVAISPIVVGTITKYYEPLE